MRRVCFLRLCLLLPLVVPLVIFAAGEVLDAHIDPHGGWARGSLYVVGIYSFGTLLLGGVPYLIFLAYAAIRLRHRGEAAHLALIRRAPQLFTGLVGGLWFALLLPAEGWRQAAAIGGGLALIGFVTAWAYVGLAHALLHVLDSASLLRES